MTQKTGVVYTCVTGEYDDLRDHAFIDPQWDYVCFSDCIFTGDLLKLNWKIKPLAFDSLDNVRNQRWHKLNPHLLFPEYDKSIYVDTNVNILDSVLFDDVKLAIDNVSAISVAPHRDRNCIYDEFITCMALGKDNKQIIEKQKQLIYESGFPTMQGLFDCSIIYRKHHDDKIIALMNDWWWWVKNYSRRDQLSFTYVLWKHGITISHLSKTGYRKSDNIEFRYCKNHITPEELRVKEERKKQRRKLSNKFKRKLHQLLKLMAY